MVGHPGDAPGISPIRTARIAVFLVPEEILVESRGVAPRSVPCHDAVLLLNDDPEMVGPAGNAPALSSPPDWRIAFFLWPELKWMRAPDSHRVGRFCKPMVRLFTLHAIESGETRGICTHHHGFHRAGC